eukprot:2545778-Prymnesium_polylepis.1
MQHFRPRAFVVPAGVRESCGTAREARSRGAAGPDPEGRGARHPSDVESASDRAWSRYRVAPFVSV